MKATAMRTAGSAPRHEHNKCIPATITEPPPLDPLFATIRRQKTAGTEGTERMFFKNLQMKKGVTLSVILAEAYLPVRLGHRDADKVFGDPLRAQLAAAGLGTLNDCRPRLSRTGEILGVDLFLGLTDARRSALETVSRMLEALKAPLGSSIRLSDGIGDPLIFGITEGLELSIASEATPNAETRRELALTCHNAMENSAVSRGWARRKGETVFYFYGESFAEMQNTLAKILSGHPRFCTAVTRRLA